jgi:hypothetical protein
MDSRLTLLHPRAGARRGRGGGGQPVSVGEDRSVRGHGSPGPSGLRLDDQLLTVGRRGGGWRGSERGPKWWTNPAQKSRRPAMKAKRPVPHTDTGGQGAQPSRWTSDPPLRNSANWPRNFGRRGAPLACGEGTFGCRCMREGAAGSRLKRLFTKNTGLCHGASRSIGADACPVPEGQGEPWT